MDYQFLQNTLLFHGCESSSILSMLDCLGAKQKSFLKGAVIFHAGQQVNSMGLVLSGSVQIENNDLWGNRSVLDRIEPGFIFAETYSFVQNEPMMVSAVAAQPSEILFLNANRILQTCPNTCPHHSRLIQNLLTISAQKTLSLSRRIFHTSAKTIRGRLLSYLSDYAARQNSREFTIPFNRQQLADYLSVERSALSNELSKMQRDGILKTEKNHFCLFQDPSRLG